MNIKGETQTMRNKNTQMINLLGTEEHRGVL